MTTKFKPIICLDFDGVLHSYISGWKGARNIPDPPVPGAIDWLVRLLGDPRVTVCVLSSRSHQWGGRSAMRRWLREQVKEYLWSRTHDFGDGPETVANAIARTPWTGLDVEAHLRHAAREIVARINFPKHKPPAHIMIDDRAVGFSGVFPNIETILAFRPWRVTAEMLDAAETAGG